MKFAIDIRGIDDRPAGKEQYLLNILKGLAKIDRLNSFLLFSDQPVRLPFALPKNFKPRIERGFGPWWHVRIARLIEEERVDGYLAALSYLVPALTDVPVLLVVHDLASFSHPETTSWKTRAVEGWALKRAIQRASRVACDSEATRQALVSLSKISNCRLVYPGLDPDFGRVSSLAARLAVSKKYSLPSHFLLFVGTLEPRKNIPTLLEAYWLLPQTLRKGYPLVLVGKKGWKYQEVFSTIRHLNLKGDVRHLDYVRRADLPAIYSLATAFVFPSLAEGFGLPVLEAMSCGLPVIVSNSTSLPEIVGRAGLLVPPSDPKMMAATIERLLSAPRLRRKLRSQGYRQARGFSWQKAAAELHRLLLEIGTTDFQPRSRTQNSR